MAGPIAALAMQLMQEQVAKDPEQFRQPVPIVEPKQKELVTPQLAHMLGGLADAASTYTFAKRGTGVEQNPLLKNVKNPEMLGLAALGGLGATKAIAAVIRKKYPKLADALSANLGGEQMILAAENFKTSNGSSFEHYKNKMEHYKARKK